MRYRLPVLFCMFLLLMLVFSNNVRAQEEEGDETTLQGKGPLPLEQMEAYKDIPFSVENFEKIQKGMTVEEVLSSLGKPVDMKKEHRRRNRWAFHYYYPDGYVVNFRNYLVVGTEKPQ